MSSKMDLESLWNKPKRQTNAFDQLDDLPGEVYNLIDLYNRDSEVLGEIGKPSRLDVLKPKMMADSRGNTMELVVLKKLGKKTLQALANWLDADISRQDVNKEKVVAARLRSTGGVLYFKQGFIIVKVNNGDVHVVTPNNTEALMQNMVSRGFKSVKTNKKKKKKKRSDQFDFVIDGPLGPGPEQVHQYPKEYCWRCQRVNPDIPSTFGLTKDGKPKKLGEKFPCVGIAGCLVPKFRLEEMKYGAGEIQEVAKSWVYNREFKPMAKFMKQHRIKPQDPDSIRNSATQIHDEVNWNMFLMLDDAYPNFFMKLRELKGA